VRGVRKEEMQEKEKLIKESESRQEEELKEDADVE